MKRTNGKFGGKILLLSALFCAVVLLASCKSMVRAPVSDAAIATKDYTVVGVVTESGKGATYRALMLKAQEMGADAVINVYHDVGGFFSRHYLTGLAIKYTAAVNSGSAEAKNLEVPLTKSYDIK